MTATEFDFMPLDRQLFRRPVAAALAELLRQKYPSAKAMARAIGFDPSTAENIRKGHVSIVGLERALLAEGRELWRRLGEEIFGETDLEYEERLLEQRIQEAERARSNIQRIRARRQGLEARADSLVGVSTRQAPDPKRGVAVDPRAQTDGLGAEAPGALGPGTAPPLRRRDG
jgi:hypothetical protein